MIDFMKLPAPDAERLCYAEGFTQAAQLFERIADLQHALGVATAEIETLKNAALDLKIKTVECEILESELQGLEKQNAAMHRAIVQCCDIMLTSPMSGMQILEDAL